MNSRFQAFFCLLMCAPGKPAPWAFLSGLMQTVSIPLAF